MTTSTANWNAAFGTTGTPTVSKFVIGDEIFKESEFLQAPGENKDFIHKKYCVIHVGLKLVVDEVHNLAGAQASPDLGGVNSPFWYQLQTVTGAIKDAVITHESDTKTLAEIKTVVGTEVNDWT